MEEGYLKFNNTSTALKQETVNRCTIFSKKSFLYQHILNSYTDKYICYRPIYRLCSLCQLAGHNFMSAQCNKTEEQYL